MIDHEHDLPAPDRGAEAMTMDRRRALKRLGFLAGSAYLAPTLLTLQGALAKDDGPPDDGPPGPDKKKSKPSKKPPPPPSKP